MILHMNEGGGTTTYNSVNGRPHALLNQGAWVTGKLGWGTNLNAVNGTRITSEGDIPEANLSSRSTFTVVLTIKPYSPLPACKVLAKGSNSGNSWDFDIESAITQDLCISITDGGPRTTYGTAGNFWPTLNRWGQWNTFFIVHTAKGISTTSTNWRFYINGVSSDNWKAFDIAGGDPITLRANTDPVVVGNYSSGGVAQKCNVDFDEIGIFMTDVTRGTDEGAMSFYRSIAGPGSSLFNP